MDSMSFRRDKRSRNIAMVFAIIGLCVFIYAFQSADLLEPPVTVTIGSNPAGPEEAASEVYTGREACAKLRELQIQLSPQCDE